MLGLDHLHRANNPLGPVEAGKLRWAAADAIGCDYAKRYAEADLRRAGLTDKDLRRLDDPNELSGAGRATLTFARKMSRAAHTVTDAEMADLLDRFGPERVVAMVHTLAFANFQVRIFLALRVAKGGPFDQEKKLPPQIEENVRRTYHLNEPLRVQYLLYVKGLLRGDLGPSLKRPGTTVNEIIAGSAYHPEPGRPSSSAGNSRWLPQACKQPARSR